MRHRVSFLLETAGFTGTRCAYTVVPKELQCGGVSLNALWLRRQTTKFNGVPYIVQKGAAAIYSEQGQKEIRETIDYYRNNAKTIREVWRRRLYRIRRRERSLHLDENAGQHDLLGLLRYPAS